MSDCGEHFGPVLQHRYGEKDEENTFQLYKKAAETGYVKAPFCVALCYYFGEGVDVNKKKAFEMFKKTFEMGDENSVNYLAWFYETGEGREEGF